MLAELRARAAEVRGTRGLSAEVLAGRVVVQMRPVCLAGRISAVFVLLSGCRYCCYLCQANGVSLKLKLNWMP
jgi:hypothetical protein